MPEATMNREDAINIAVITERLTNFEANMDSKLDAIYAQTTKTNGRVTKIEMERAEEAGRTKSEAKLFGLIGGVISSVAVGVVTFFITHNP